MQFVPAPSLFRAQEGMGRWEHRGKVAAVGIGHVPTYRRWDGDDPNTSVGALAVQAIRTAITDAGVAPEEVDGLCFAPDTTTGAYWPPDRSTPEAFVQAFKTTDDPRDGISKLSAEWLLKNLPELKNVKMVVNAPRCMSHVLVSAIESVGSGLATTCVAVKGWHNFGGRYYHGGVNAEPTVSGERKFRTALSGPMSFPTAMQFQRYLHKYNKSHEMMGPFVVNSRRNGLLFPEGYWAQHRPEPLTVDEYNSARWIAKPASILDHDIPIHTAGAYVITTSERSANLRQKPVYVLGHAAHGLTVGDQFLPARPRSTVHTLEEIQECAASTGRKIYESAAITPEDLSFENMYDGFSLFHVFHIEGLRYAGIKEGEALDLYQTDVSIEGPNPVSPSGGNLGGGRTRFWNHTDSMQQIQGRAGARQITKSAEVGVSGGPMPYTGNYVVWSATPN